MTPNRVNASADTEHLSLLREGILQEKDIAALQSLHATEIFKVLQSQMSTFYAVRSLRHFQRPDTLSLITSLWNDPEWTKERDQIAYVARECTHTPATHDAAVDFLTNIKNPYVMKESDDRTIVMARTSDVSDAYCVAPCLREKNKEFTKICAAKGDLFLVRNPRHETVSVALANRSPETLGMLLNFIGTHQNARRQGHGRALIEYILKEHALLLCTLFSEGDLSDEMLRDMGFKKSPEGNTKWDYRPSLR